MTGFRGKLKLNYLKPRGELYLGDNMKKEYTLKLTCDDRDDICEVEEDFNTMISNFMSMTSNV